MTSSTRTCSVNDCDRAHDSRGWCKTHYSRWQRHGDPEHTEFIRGDDEARFWSYVGNRGDGCWVWAGRLDSNGYGYPFRQEGQLVFAHRYSYELHVGPIPDGLHLDHLCRNTSCVNPAHLEAVTPGENVLRGVGPSAVNARKTHCKRGHLLAGDGIYRYGNRRVCKACNVLRKKAHR